MKNRKSMKSQRNPHANWQIDYDYLDKLNPEELEQLRKFTNEFYLSGKGELQSTEQLRERRRAYKANQADLMGRELAGHTPLKPAHSASGPLEAGLVEEIDWQRAGAPCLTAQQRKRAKRRRSR